MRIFIGLGADRDVPDLSRSLHIDHFAPTINDAMEPATAPGIIRHRYFPPPGAGQSSTGA